MSAQFVIDTSEIEKFTAMLPQLDRLMAEEISAWMAKALAILDTAIRLETPVFLGSLRAAFAHKTTGHPLTRYEGIEFNPLIYAPAVEYGRRPGKRPPVGPIELWVNRRLGIGGKEGRQVAYLIARAIGRRGTKGARMAEKGFNQTEPIIIRLYDEIPEAAFARFVRIA